MGREVFSPRVKAALLVGSAFTLVAVFRSCTGAFVNEQLRHSDPNPTSGNRSTQGPDSKAPPSPIYTRVSTSQSSPTGK